MARGWMPAVPFMVTPLAKGWQSRQLGGGGRPCQFVGTMTPPVGGRGANMLAMTT
jgi:hypothetical protein